MEPPPLSILDSLHASRQNILHTAFPPFSSPSLPQLQHPPHRITHFATTNCTIGPHSFASTKFYLVEWTSTTHPSSHPPPPPLSVPRAASPPRPASPPKASNPAAITPSLIQRLNAASQHDPALATLLRRAATGQATPDELGGLSKKIEQLRKEEESEQNPTPPPAPPALDTPPVGSPHAQEGGGGIVPHPALVIEFAESSPNLFLIPDHFLCVTLTPRSAPSVPLPTVALLLSFFVFPPDRSLRGREHEFAGIEGGMAAPPPVPIDMIVEGVREDERDKFMRASRLGRARDTGLENWWENTIGSVPSRVHVIHQAPPVVPKLPLLPEAPSLSRTNSESTVPMKRGASGTPMSASGGAGGGGGTNPNKRGKPMPTSTTSISMDPPLNSRRRATRGSTTRSTVDYRDSPEPSPPPEPEDYLPAPNSLLARNSVGRGGASASPAPVATPPARKKPGPKKGWKKNGAVSARSKAGGGGGGGGNSRRKKKKEASSDEDDWSGIKVIE